MSPEPAPNYLLSLAALHAVAPDVLDVVFGPDGAFEGAPHWCPPLWTGTWDREDVRWGWRWDVIHDGERLMVPDEDCIIEDAALDLRVPSVAARLAWLCARAMGHHQPATWSIQDERGGIFALVGVIHTPRTSFDSTIVLRWDRGRAMGYGSGGDAQHPSITTVATDGGAFLRDLVLALAPKIAALP